MRRIGSASLMASVACAAVVASIAASSCWSPAFDPNLSLAAATIAKMDKVATIDVTEVRRSEMSSGFFTPRRVAAPADGLWVMGDGGDDEPFYWASPLYMASATASSLRNVTTATFEPPSSEWPVISMSPQGTMEALAPVKYKSSAPWGLVELYPTASDDSGPIGVDESSADFSGSGEYLGTGFVAETSTSDKGCSIVHEETSDTHLVLEYSYSGGVTAVDATVSVTLPADLAPTAPGFAARSGDYWFLSVVDSDGEARNIRWSVGAPTDPVELQLGEPLVGILRDGTLLSSDGMTTTARDSAGDALYSFPSGSLRFVHERYDDSESIWMAVFVRSLFVPVGNDGYSILRSEVYEIPSLSLPTLAK